MKTLCSALLECMILPLQDKVEDWRKNVGVLDKEHAKEYKKVLRYPLYRYQYQYNINKQ